VRVGTICTRSCAVTACAWIRPTAARGPSGRSAGRRVKAPDLGLDLRGLERLGPFVPQLREEQSWQRRVGLAQARCGARRRGRGCIASLRRWGLRSRRPDAVGGCSTWRRRGTCRSGGLRRACAARGAVWCLRAGAGVAARDVREEERRAAGIAERVERLRETPELVLERLAETRSVWSAADVEREGRSALGVRAGYEEQVDVATRAVVGASLALDGDAFTPERVVTKVRAILEAAAMLAERQRVVELRAPDVGLDD